MFMASACAHCGTAESSSLRSLSPSTVTLGCTVPRASLIHVGVERFYRAAFHNIGVQLTLIAMPNLREQAALVAGELDGVCGRVKQFDHLSNQNYLQRVPVVIAYSDVSAFSFTKRDSLMDKGERLNVGYNLGELSVQRILPALRHHRHKPAPTAEKALQWLISGSIDSYVGDDLHFDSAWRAISDGRELHRQVVYTDEYFMFLDKKFSAKFIDRLQVSLTQQLELNGGALSFRDVFAGNPVLVKYMHTELNVD